MADPLSITTAIITLSNTLERVITLLGNFRTAKEKLAEIKQDCALTQSVLEYLRRQLQSSSPPTLLIDRSDESVGKGTGSCDAGINLANVLWDNVAQLQLDLNAFVTELAALGKTWRGPESRLTEILTNGHVAWKMSYLERMRQKIVTKRMQLELVRNSLQSDTNNPLGGRRTSDDSVLIATFLDRFLRRPSSASDSLRPPNSQDQENIIRTVKKGTRRELEGLLTRASPNFAFGSRELYPLHYAAARGDLGIVNLLLSKAATIDYCNRDSETPLMIAISHNHPVVALALIRRGADIRLSDTRGRTALHIAAKVNLYAVTKVLLSNGADVDAQDTEGRTPLMESVCRSDRDIQPHDTSVLRVLMEGGGNRKPADPTLGLFTTNYTPLHHAAALNYTEDLELMLTSPSNPSPATRLVLDSDSRTPLYHAAQTGNLPTLTLLLRLGTPNPAIINHPSRSHPYAPTPLWALATSPNLPPPTILKGAAALLTAHTDPNTPNHAGHTLLHLASAAGNVPLLTLLLSHGADPFVRDKASLLPIHHAARTGRGDVISILLSHPLPKATENGIASPGEMMVNARDATGVTPLMLAAEHGHDYLVHMLVKKHGADWGMRDEAGCDAFYVACARGQLGCAAYLLGCGAELDGRTRKGNTALMVSVKVGEVRGVEWLLRMGADRDVRSVEPFEKMEVVGTAADIARGAGLEKEVEEKILALLEAGGDAGGTE